MSPIHGLGPGLSSLFQLGLVAYTASPLPSYCGAHIQMDELEACQGSKFLPSRRDSQQASLLLWGLWYLIQQLSQAVAMDWHWSLVSQVAACGFCPALSFPL